MIIARTVFFLSFATTLFWVFGFVAERVVGTEPPLWSYAAPTILICAVSALGIFQAWPSFLTISPGTTGRFVRGIAVWTVPAYLIGVVAVGGLAYWLLNPSAQPSEDLRNEASLAAYILALWFPLWFAPAIGLSLGWWLIARPVRSNPTIERSARVGSGRPSL